MENSIHLIHHRQLDDGRCLPACVKMILDRLGFQLDEDRIASLLGTRSYGTPGFAVRRLESLGLQISYEEGSIAQLLSLVNAHIPVIAFVRTGFLEYWNLDIAHAVVVVGTEADHQFLVHDPAQENGPIAVSWNGFLAAWAEFGC